MTVRTDDLIRSATPKLLSANRDKLSELIEVRLFPRPHHRTHPRHAHDLRAGSAGGDDRRSGRPPHRLRRGQAHRLHGRDPRCAGCPRAGARPLQRRGRAPLPQPDVRCHAPRRRQPPRPHPLVLHRQLRAGRLQLVQGHPRRVPETARIRPLHLLPADPEKGRPLRQRDQDALRRPDRTRRDGAHLPHALRLRTDAGRALQGAFPRRTERMVPRCGVKSRIQAYGRAVCPSSRSWTSTFPNARRGTTRRTARSSPDDKMSGHGYKMVNKFRRFGRASLRQERRQLRGDHQHALRLQRDARTHQDHG